MKRDQSFHDYVVGDLLRDVPGISSRAMFSGWGVYARGIMFGIIIDGELYVKVNDRNKEEFQKRGSHPFTYTTKNRKPTTMSYWVVPDEVLEDKEQLYQFVDAAIEAQRNSKKYKNSKHC